MAILTWQSSERGVEIDAPFATCCGHDPEVLHFKRGHVYTIYCRRKGCINERQGVLAHDNPRDAHAKWEMFRIHHDLR